MLTLVNDDDRLLAELRRILAVVDPVPVAVQDAARGTLRWRGEPPPSAPPGGDDLPDAPEAPAG